MNARQHRAILKRQEAYRRETNASAEAAGEQYLAWVKANKPYGVKDNNEAFSGFIAGWTLREQFRPIKTRRKS